MIYGDTSFLLAIYRQGDHFHNQAVKLSRQLREPFALTLLGELELVNGVRRCFAASIIDQRENDAIFRQISGDEADGILVRQIVNDLELFARARELSKEFTPETSARSLDILHVAAAQLLRVSKFITFDGKQRLLARKTALSVLPRLPAGKTS
jgi:predicted nucleic acid-binding protein